MTTLRFPSRRSPVLARHGMVATSQPLAAMAGLRVLADGGNAADAAVTTAAMLNVVEPMSTGIGGDCFALIYEARSGQVTALNGSGRAPQAFTLAEAHRLGLETMPATGPLAVTTPGTVSGWASLLERFGSLSLAQCLSPAIDAATNGFPVSSWISSGWQQAGEKLAANEEASRVYLPAPLPGELHTQPDLANTLRRIATDGPQAFYQGDIAERIAACVQEAGGYLSTDDLSSHTSAWEKPIRTSYRNTEILEHPPNGQGLAALIALNIVEGFDLGGMSYFSPQRWHVMIEAMRMAMVDAAQFVCDPNASDIPLDQLLSKGYAERQRKRIQTDEAMCMIGPGQPEHKDTVYLTVVDPEGNAVSFINSLFHGFGSGLVVPGTGICLQNRGACFSLEKGHPNALDGGKRPYHTIIPAMALREGKPWLTFGVMGGFMQPQGHLQVLVNMVDFGLDPQTALDAPRFRVDQTGGPSVHIETGVPAETRKRLAAWSHEVVDQPTFTPGFGGGQIIAIDPDTGVRWGGSDPRKDGCAVGF